MRIMPTLIAAILGALAAWGLILAIWLCFEYPYSMAVVMVTAGGALVGAYLYVEFAEIDVLYEDFPEWYE